MEQANSGKASILNEAARILKDLRGQIDALKKENASLLFESRYVSLSINSASKHELFSLVLNQLVDSFRTNNEEYCIWFQFIITVLGFLLLCSR